MFIEDLRKDFYNQLLGKQVLILANHDVDSLCTCKILQRLFRDDGVHYTLKPVQGIEDVRTHYKKAQHNIDVLVLINCGATVDVMEILEQPQQKAIYVFDSHKPVHILNIYDESKQVRIVISPQDSDNIPSFEDVFRADDLDDILNEDDDENESADGDMDTDSEDVPIAGRKRKRSRLDPEMIKKKKDYAEWQERRQQILFDYTNFTSYGTPSALYALELAWKLSRDQTEIIWWAAISLAESFMLERITRTTYLLLVTELQDHVARVTHAHNIPRDCLKVVFENELGLLLYRHWTLYESIKMTPYCATKFRSWCHKGEQRYHEFLADAGLPLSQVKQKFSSMDLSLRRILKDTFCGQRIRSKYRFDDILIGTFISQIGFQSKYNAIDTGLCAMAILESPDIEKSPSEKFMMGLEFLNKGNTTMMEMGLNYTKNLIAAVYNQVQAVCDLNQALIFGPFMFIQIQPGVDVKYFSLPNAARFLVQFAIKAIVSSRCDGRLKQLPMVLMTPQNDDMYLVIGIPPVAVDTTQSLFGKAFETVATKMTDAIVMDYFDASVVQVKASEKGKFLDMLLILLL